MSTEQSKETQKKSNNDAAVKPDSETLKTTDPQEHMEGPLSSLMKKAGEDLGAPEAVDEGEDKKAGK
ncbi:MAG: hypothetical protein WKF70_12290 [Chitinophagaceae bacterium]